MPQNYVLPIAGVSGPILPTPQPVIPVYNQTAPTYGAYEITVEYVHDTGKVVHRLASADEDGLGTASVQVTSPSTMKIVRFTGIRETMYPDVPHPDPDTPTCVLLTARVKIVPAHGSTGHYVNFMVTGEYVYNVLVPWVPGASLESVRVPYSDDTRKHLSSDRFVPNLHTTTV